MRWSRSNQSTCHSGLSVRASYTPDFANVACTLIVRPFARSGSAFHVSAPAGRPRRAQPDLLPATPPAGDNAQTPSPRYSGKKRGRGASDVRLLTALEFERTSPLSPQYRGEGTKPISPPPRR